jgi:hypothetical protein
MGSNVPPRMPNGVIRARRVDPRRQRFEQVIHLFRRVVNAQAEPHATASPHRVHAHIP